jgi:hypothetical protein
VKGPVETFIYETLQKNPKKTTLLYAKGDGNINEDEYNQIIEKARPGTLPIIVSLCSRKKYKSILLPPIDDDSFVHGVSGVLSNYVKPAWNDRKSIVFWRGVLTGTDVPTLRARCKIFTIK